MACVNIMMRLYGRLYNYGRKAQTPYYTLGRATLGLEHYQNQHKCDITLDSFCQALSFIMVLTAKSCFVLKKHLRQSKDDSPANKKEQLDTMF